MNISLEIVIGVQILIILIVFIWAIKSASKKKYYEKKYAKVIDIDSEVEKSKKENQKIQKVIDDLRSSYKEKKVIFDNLVNEAAILSARRGKKTIGMNEMRESIEKVILGPERKNRIMNKNNT